MYDGLPRQLTRFSRRLLNPSRILRAAWRQAGDLIAPAVAAPPTEFSARAAGGMSELTGFGANPGKLRMLVHVPPTPPLPGAPLLVLLHGCGQDAANFAAAAGFVALADRVGAALVLPEQTARNNQGRCFNWYRPTDTLRGGGESASICQMVAEALRRFEADPARVYVAGLSAGGAMAASLLAAYPDVFAAGAVVAGLPVGAATDVSSAITRMSRVGDDPRATWVARAAAVRPPVVALPPLSVWHGGGDRTVDPANGAALVAQWTGLLDLPETPDSDTAPAPGVRRRAWGRAVEYWTIDGLGHGLPIAASAPADPFVLPAPVQAADAMARFWGLADA